MRKNAVGLSNLPTFNQLNMNKVIVFLSLLLIAFSCKSRKAEPKQTETTTSENVVVLTDEQYKNAGVELGKLQQQSISSIFRTNGKIDVPPQNRVSISVPMGGYLKTTRLLPGMQVNRGAVLAVIEDPQYIQLQQDYLTAKAQFAFNEAEYLRQKELNESKATSDKVFAQTRATYQTQLVLIRSLEQKLQLIGLKPDRINVGNISKSINIYSPIRGFVSAVNVNIGKYVNPSDVLIELVDPSDIHLALTVFEKDVNKLFIGQKLMAYTNTNPGKKYPCTIILVSKHLSDDRATEVHCHFEKYDKELLPGMFMNADIDVQSRNAYGLPSDAIVNYENKQFVFVAKEKNQFEIVQVTPGSSENGYTEIDDQSVVKLKDRNVAVKGAYNLLMKLKNTNDVE